MGSCAGKDIFLWKKKRLAHARLFFLKRKMFFTLESRRLAGEKKHFPFQEEKMSGGNTYRKWVIKIIKTAKNDLQMTFYDLQMTLRSNPRAPSDPPGEMLQKWSNFPFSNSNRLENICRKHDFIRKITIFWGVCCSMDTLRPKFSR